MDGFALKAKCVLITPPQEASERWTMSMSMAMYSDCIDRQMHRGRKRVD